MKLVAAIIKSFKLDDVREVLTPFGAHGLTVTEVQGFGRQKVQISTHGGAEYSARFTPKLKVEIAVDDDVVPHVLEAIQTAAYTGNIGDGRIFVLDLVHAVRIRTGETNSDAL